MAKLSWLWVLFKVFMGLCDDDECECYSFDKFLQGAEPPEAPGFSGVFRPQNASPRIVFLLF